MHPDSWRVSFWGLTHPNARSIKNPGQLKKIKALQKNQMLFNGLSAFQIHPPLRESFRNQRY
jgi:hypothetical protein